MWFESLVGFREESGECVRQNITVDGESMTSVANGRRLVCGRLETPGLGEMRQRVRELDVPTGKIVVDEVVGDVQALHREVSNQGALFQVASQFNLLEMVSPSVTPEQGIDIYEHDLTQGPACAIACGAGTIYRNYFVPVGDQIGQTRERQIDCLRDVGDALGNKNNRLWSMRNGYALATDEGLRGVADQLATADETHRDMLRSLLRIGIQWQTQVTLGDAQHTVTQAYCSALPVSYSPLPPDLWSGFAALVLEAAYEATLCAAVENCLQTGNHRVFLTLLGGGAFGNRTEWIIAAIERALRLYASFNLHVSIVSYSSSHPGVQSLIGRL
jgi:hypothetical protein